MDVGLYLIAGLALAVALRALWSDWMQTRWISKFGAGHGIFETNLILGRHPPLWKINLWFVAWGGALCAALFMLKPWWSLLFSFVVAVVERRFVLSNQRIGVGTFPLWSANG